MDGEKASLLGGSSTSSKIWGAITVAILLFAFFAFVFAVASFAATKNINTGVSNTFYEQQGGLIKQSYQVAANVEQFDAGTILSFCDSQVGVCPGLGPRWNSTIYPPGAWSPAIQGGLVHLTPVLAVYSWVVAGDPNSLRVVAIRSDVSPPYAATPVVLSLSFPISWLAVRAYGPSSFVVGYNTHNTSYIMGGTVATSGQINLGPAVSMFAVPYTVDGFPMDVVVINSAILVTFGPNNEGASFKAFSLSGTTLSSININSQYGLQLVNAVVSVSLGNVEGVEYMLQATGTASAVSIFSYSPNTNTLSISALKTLSYTDILFDTLTATSLFNGYIALAGVQIERLETPLAISLVLQWTTQSPYLNEFFPSNLLETQEHQLVGNVLSVCYTPPSPNAGGATQGDLFFAYVESRSDRGKLVRAKIASTSPGNVQLLPSPAIDISTFTYTQYGIAIPPLLSCPSALGVLVAYQNLGTFFNHFVWEGGYRYAGIAQESFDPSTSKKAVSVMRQGISVPHGSLQPGYSYYVTNSGHLRPHTSLTEMFTASSNLARIGVAISDSQLLIDPYVFEFGR